MLRIHGLPEELFFSSTLLCGFGGLVGWLAGWSVSELVRHQCHPGLPRVISGHSENTF